MVLVMAWAGMAVSAGAADVGNRLTYLDGPVDPYVVGLQSPEADHARSGWARKGSRP